MRALVFVLSLVLGIVPAATAWAQADPSTSEIDLLRQELRRLQDRLQRLEQQQAARPAAPVPAR